MISSSFPPVGFPFVKAFIADMVRSRSGFLKPRQPLFLTYFVTFRCNLECTYCWYIGNNFSNEYPEIDTGGAREVLRICREGNPAMAFTGGEPLMRGDIVELIHYAKELRYKPISLFTNSLLLPGKEELLDDIDYLQVSLDTMNVELQDRLCRRPGSGARIVENVRRYAALQKKKHFRLNINCVLSPDTFGEVKELLQFAAETETRLSVLPQLGEHERPAGFFRDPGVLDRHHRTMDAMISSKPSTGVVFDTIPFLRHNRALKSERCYPQIMPRVYPDGSLLYPCSITCRSTVSIREMGSWKRLQAALAPVSTECHSPCLNPCYLQTSLLIRHPLVLLQEFG